MKKTVILSLVLALVVCFCTVTAFASADGNSALPYTQWEEAVPSNPELEYSDEDLNAVIEEMFGENSGILMAATICITISFLLFVPALVLMIVFIVLNSKTKKKLREYERAFGVLPQNAIGVIPNQPVQNMTYSNQPINNAGVPYGANPAQNNQQGGQF